MKALIIITVCVALAFALHAAEKLRDMKKRKARPPIDDEDRVRKALRRYRNLAEKNSLQNK